MCVDRTSTPHAVTKLRGPHNRLGKLNLTIDAAMRAVSSPALLLRLVDLDVRDVQRVDVQPLHLRRGWSRTRSTWQVHSDGISSCHATSHNTEPVHQSCLPGSQYVMSLACDAAI